MLSRKFLSIFSAVVSFSAVAPAYSIKETNTLNHRFLEIDKNDKSFKEYFEERYANLPRFRYDGVVNSYVDPRFIDSEISKPDFEENKNGKLVKVYSNDERYGIGYLVKFKNNGAECSVHDIRGLLNQYPIDNLQQINVAIFLYPFLCNEKLNKLTLQGSDKHTLSLIAPSFSLNDQAILEGVGFERHVMRNGCRSLKFTIDRKKALNYWEKASAKGRN